MITTETVLVETGKWGWSMLPDGSCSFVEGIESPHYRRVRYCLYMLNTEHLLISTALETRCVIGTSAEKFLEALRKHFEKYQVSVRWDWPNTVVMEEEIDLTDTLFRGDLAGCMKFVVVHVDAWTAVTVPVAQTLNIYERTNRKEERRLNAEQSVRFCLLQSNGLYS